MKWYTIQNESKMKGINQLWKLFFNLGVGGSLVLPHASVPGESLSISVSIPQKFRKLGAF